MSTALAIAGVTQVLRDRLNDGLVNSNVAGVTGNTVEVSVSPPDQVAGIDGQASSQLNVFLFNVSPNSGWNLSGYPSHDVSGKNRLTNPPLALNLHYLISAYGDSDLHAEILLGYAVQLMHENPIITREMLRASFSPAPDVGATLPPALRALADTGLADQFEQLRITPHYLNVDEVSKLWTAMQTNYRPSAVYEVSVVLIQAEDPVRSALPVLSRGEIDPVSGRDRGVVVTPDLVPPYPTISAVLPDGDQPAAVLGQTVVIEGHLLDGTGREVRLVNERFGVDEVLAASGTSAADRMEFSIPLARAADFPVGVYDVTANVIMPGDTVARTSNRLALLLAPEITNLPQNVVRDGIGDIAFTLSFTPELRGGQSVAVVFGQQEVAPLAHATPTGTLDLAVPDVEVGSYLNRLRIDGVDSPIIDRAATPPEFLDRRVNVT